VTFAAVNRPRVHDAPGTTVDRQIEQAARGAASLHEDNLAARLQSMEVIPARVMQTVARQLTRNAAALGKARWRWRAIVVVGSVGVPWRRGRPFAVLVIGWLVEISGDGRKSG
jgi:hypothetical protein